MPKITKRKSDVTAGAEIVLKILLFGFMVIIFIFRWIYKNIKKLFAYIRSKQQNSNREMIDKNAKQSISVNEEQTKINLYYKGIETISDYLNEQLIYTDNEVLKLENVATVDLGKIVNIMYNDIKYLKSENEIDSIFDYTYYQKYMRIFFNNNINHAKEYMGNNIVIGYSECGMPDRYFDNDVADELQFHLDALVEYKQLHLYDYYDEFIKLRNMFFHHHYNGKNNFFDDTKDKIVKNEIYYTVDAFVTCVCISKIIYILDKVNNLNPDSELYIMMKKMIDNIKDKELIIKKITPIYKELYNNDLGNLKSDYSIRLLLEFLYSKVEENTNTNDCKEYTSKDDIEKMIDNLILEKSILKNRINIENTIIKELSTYHNYKVEDSINILSEIKRWSQNYYNLYSKNKSLSEKERFLNGDFGIEEQEFNEKYNLNNITTGSQFELYLENIFKDLGYKVRHTGKAGDQGADLVLKYGDKIYVVQAKYYSSKLDNTPVQEIVGAIKYYNANQGVVVTNSSFTNGAEQLAKANNIILIDGIELKQLVDLVFENPNEDVLEKYNP